MYASQLPAKVADILHAMPMPLATYASEAGRGCVRRSDAQAAQHALPCSFAAAHGCPRRRSQLLLPCLYASCGPHELQPHRPVVRTREQADTPPGFTRSVHSRAPARLQFGPGVCEWVLGKCLLLGHCRHVPASRAHHMCAHQPKWNTGGAVDSGVASMNTDWLGILAAGWAQSDGGAHAWRQVKASVRTSS